jgi:hypothetical protein
MSGFAAFGVDRFPSCIAAFGVDRAWRAYDSKEEGAGA